MIYQPFEDPRRFLDARAGELEQQLAGTGALGREILGQVEGLQEKFRANEIPAETICRSAMHLYWKNQRAISGTPAGGNLATLGHDLGAYANVDIEELEHYWNSAQRHNLNP